MTFVFSEGYAGEYEVWYQGQKYNANMIINCDNTVIQPGLFHDALHFDGVSSKCNTERDAKSTIFILNTQGEGKHECLHKYDKYNGVIGGNHYGSTGAYWGSVEYRPITRNSCSSNF